MDESGVGTFSSIISCPLVHEQNWLDEIRDNLVLNRLYNQHHYFDIGITPRSRIDKIDVNRCQRRLDQSSQAIRCQKQL